MTRRLRDLPPSPFFTVDMRCDCGAPCESATAHDWTDIRCIKSGKPIRYCEGYRDRGEREGWGDPFINDSIKAEVKATRRAYFQEMRRAKP